ncbi:MAG TPA: Ppx/GppA phosphatase family protein [Nitrospiraceae bacterium]|nr:Ppx/GppA phosphatase family protein [Nitrospiraceae bacterium]
MNPAGGGARVLAGVDIGTLTCRLLIAKATAGGGLAKLHAERRILRLGEGVDHHRLLQPAAMKRVIETLHEWRQTIERYHVDRRIAVATSAVRDAINRDAFLAMVKQETGFEVEVISGEEEARRTLLGIRAGLSPGTGDIVGLDIGGGSTEFIIDRRGRPPAVRSIELGVVRLTERLFKHDPPMPEELEAAWRLILDLMQPVKLELGDLAGLTFVGTAGTVTTLAAMAQRLPRYEAARVHQYGLSLQTIRELEQTVVSRSNVQRRELPGLEAGREEVVVAGTLILRTVMECLGFQDCVVSEMGLREGVLIDLAQRIA